MKNHLDFQPDPSLRATRRKQHLAWRYHVTACLAFLSGVLFAQAPPPPTVKVAQGEAAGRWIQNNSQKAYLGLPYAAPPVGPLRWRAPEAPAPWKGTRNAVNYAARCEQYHIWNDYIFQDAGPSEDCLYLNVYTPAAAKPSDRLPVMFWIHGGGFIAGAGSEPRYSNSALVSKGVILVTINYRLGVFGFLTSEELAKADNGHAGDYGLMDMVAALRWVKANIAAFGGDPGNITIFGESAGSFAVNALTVAPDAHGLFQKAIGESGAFFGGAIPLLSGKERHARDQAWIDSLGVKSLAELRALPAETILASVQKQPGVSFAPVVDGKFLPESIPDAYAAGRQAHVPEIIGWNRDERAGTLSKDMTAAKWKAYAAEHYGPRADAFLAAFPATSDEEAVRSADDFTTASFIAMEDGSGRRRRHRPATLLSTVTRFDRPAPPEENHPQGKYAFHSDELEYVFGTLDVRHGAVWQAADRKLSDEMTRSHCATNFAARDPNGPGLPPVASLRQECWSSSPGCTHYIRPGRNTRGVRVPGEGADGEIGSLSPPLRPPQFVYEDGTELWSWRCAAASTSPFAAPKESCVHSYIRSPPVLIVDGCGSLLRSRLESACRDLSGSEDH